IGSDDTGAAGLTVPTQSMKNDLDADKDKELHYNGSVVSGGKSGKERGAIIIVDRFEDGKGNFLPRNADEIAGTLFHELFHAGQISQGQPYSHSDKRFEQTIKIVEEEFKHCAT
ncbi:MAG: hypothetical protein H7Y20_08550, partial [Bryobacteraceae bacterium]|nr:hypothetical protein [Bryobacteraceae bacterium]